MLSVRIKVSAGSKIEKVEEIGDGILKIRVREQPEKGKANDRVIELVAAHFGVPKSLVVLKSGASSRDKVVLVDKTEGSQKTVPGVY